MSLYRTLSSSQNSLFLDAHQFKIPDKVLVDEFKDELIRVAFNPALGLIELVFLPPKSFEKHLSTPFKYNPKQIHLSPPRNYICKKLILHLHGMPILYFIKGNYSNCHIRISYGVW